MWKKWRKLGDLWGLKYIFQQEGEACPHHFSASASKWKNSTYSLGKRNAQVYPDHQVNPAHHFSFFFPTGERKLTATGAGYNKNRQIFPPPLFTEQNSHIRIPSLHTIVCLASSDTSWGANISILNAGGGRGKIGRDKPEGVPRVSTPAMLLPITFTLTPLSGTAPTSKPQFTR